MGMTFAFLQSLGSSLLPVTTTIQKLLSGLAITASSLSASGYHGPQTYDIQFKFFFTWSSSSNGTYFFLQTFSVVTRIWDFWKPILFHILCHQVPCFIWQLSHIFFCLPFVIHALKRNPSHCLWHFLTDSLAAGTLTFLTPSCKLRQYICILPKSLIPPSLCFLSAL